MRPLEGVTVLDLSRVLACPFASMILAELGATVIKLEQPGCGDETRSFEPFVGTGDAAQSAYFLAFNRSKESITVDLRRPEGQALVRRLAQGADVLLENFPPGTLDRYGLGYAALAESMPRLVYVSCTAFGATGPYSHRKGYDTIFQAMGGLMSLTGERDGPPVKAGLPIADLTSGLWLAIAMLAALAGRAKTGRGSRVDFGMLDGQVALLSLAAARYFALGEVPVRMGTEHPGRVPSAAFLTADDHHVQITCSDQHWRPLCELLGLPGWANDPSLAANADRVARRDEVMTELATAIRTLSCDELCRRCDAAGVPAGPVLDVAEIFANEQVLSRGMLAGYEHPAIGRFSAVPLPLRFDGLDDPVPGRPPLLGEHTRDVLARLGLSAEAIAALEAGGVVGPPPGTPARVPGRGPAT